jgi:uncharacterized protein (DUF1501 family)
MNDTTTRRDLLRRTGVLALGALTLPSPLRLPRVALAPESAPTPGDILVCVFMRGAADGLNLVPPLGDKNYFTARPALALAEPQSNKNEAAVDLDGFFGLHPLLKPLKEFFDAGALAIVHAVGSPDPTHSHFDAMDFMERGTPGDKGIPTGWIGRHLQVMASNNKSPFRAIGMGTLLQQSLRGQVPATALQSIADFHLQGDQKKLQPFQNALASLYAGDGFIESEGQQTLQAMRDLSKLTTSNYTPSGGAKYPDTPFGKAMANVAQLIKAEMGLEVACVDLGGWDTHVQQDTQMPRLIDEFAKALAAFYADTQDQMKRITLVTMTEFGRRVQENTSRGTDHGHGGVMFLMGGGINGGKVFGDWPGLSKDNLYGPGDLAITTDFRDVLGELVQKRLPNPNLASVFPNYPTFKFRGVLKDNKVAQAQPFSQPITIALPFGVKIPLGAGK